MGSVFSAVTGTGPDGSGDGSGQGRVQGRIRGRVGDLVWKRVWELAQEVLKGRDGKQSDRIPPLLALDHLNAKLREYIDMLCKILHKFWHARKLQIHPVSKKRTEKVLSGV